MRKWFIVFAGVAALTSFAPAAQAQIGIDLPGVGVRIGEPHPHYGYTYREEPRVYHAPAYREREVYLNQRSSCRTVTIERDGVMKRIRRCD
jgi:hypothetical protein